MKSPESNRPSFPLCRHLAFACPPFQLIILQFRFLQLFFFFSSFQTLSDGVVVVVVVSLLFSRFSRFDLIFSVAPFFSPSHRFRKSKSFEAFRTLKSSCPYNLFPMDGCGWNCRVMYLLFPFFFLSLFISNISIHRCGYNARRRCFEKSVRHNETSHNGNYGTPPRSTRVLKL